MYTHTPHTYTQGEERERTVSQEVWWLTFIISALSEAGVLYKFETSLGY